MPKKYENPILEIVETEDPTILAREDAEVSVPDNYFD